MFFQCYLSSTSMRLPFNLFLFFDFRCWSTGSSISYHYYNDIFNFSPPICNTQSMVEFFSIYPHPSPPTVNSFFDWALFFHIPLRAARTNKDREKEGETWLFAGQYNNINKSERKLSWSILICLSWMPIFFKWFVSVNEF